MRSKWGGSRRSGCAEPREVERGRSFVGLGTGLLLALVLPVTCLLFAAPAVGAPGNHVFSPLLSLTGGTSVSPVDPVPDPGPDHPSAAFGEVCGVAVDDAGYTYVATLGEAVEGETINGRIDIFDPEGHYLLEIKNDHRPCDMAVDSEGELYVVQADPEFDFSGAVLYSPDEYPPTPTTDYGLPTFVDESAGIHGLAVNRTNDHLFVARGTSVAEYSSASTGNLLITSSIGAGIVNEVHGLAVDSSTGNLFVASVCQGCSVLPSPSKPFVSVIDIFDSAGALIDTIDGSGVPAGGFESAFGKLSVAVDEGSGEVFVADIEANILYRFVQEGGGYHWVADSELEEHSYKPENKVAVSNGPTAPTKSNVYVTSPGPPGHMFVFLAPTEVGEPIITNTAFDNPAYDEAELKAEINPNGAGTEYRIEYVAAEIYEQDIQALGPDHGFDHATVASTGVLPLGSQPIPVSTVVTGLAPGSSYRFRIVAENCKEGEPRPCESESDAVLFATYPNAGTSGPCPNEVFRFGNSAGLPDCRAYELVTPPNTNGRTPYAAFVGFAPSVGFPTELVTEDGSGLLFMTDGGSLPVLGGNGVQDGYEARRGASGWEVQLSGPDGAQSQTPLAGGASPDHGYWAWTTGGAKDHGNLVIGGKETTYVRNPDGTFELLGDGVLADDPRADAHMISSGGDHTIFSSTVPLMNGASPAGTRTIYDRRGDGSLQIVSLEPSGDAPAAGSEVSFQGSDKAGDTVAFSVSADSVTTLLLRDSSAGTTASVASGTVQFAGLSDDGALLTYLKGGNLFSFDAATGNSMQIGFGGESTAVNVSADGSDVYFVSPKALIPKGPSGGQQNFYVWSAETSTIAFIGRLTPLDVQGVNSGEEKAYGLGLWVEGFNNSGILGPAIDPSRTTPDGEVIVFESHANLTDYDSEGHSEIYRYATGETPALICLSCNPTLLSAASDAHLQIPVGADPLAVTNGQTPVHNLTPDGVTAFFQTGDALVPADVDEMDDVYEWKAAGTGGCSISPGCLGLISSGHSSAPDYLYAVTPDGHDAFFSTSDQLLAIDTDPTTSIYDARVNGGFPEPFVDRCAGDACKEAPVAPPPLGSPGSTATGKSGNVTNPKRCRKGQRKVRRGKRVKCVTRHRKHHKHQAKRPQDPTRSRGAR